MNMTEKQIKRVADRILYEYGLFERLKEIGVPHIIGSYRMDMMANNDLDIDVENDKMSLEKLYDLTAHILKTFHPVWYEAKQETDGEGKTVWFQGFEFQIEGDLFNVDIWFFDRDTILKAENYCDGIKKRATSEQKSLIVSIKRELLSRGLYGFDKFTSMHVYEAVLEKHIAGIEEFLKFYKL